MGGGRRRGRDDARSARGRLQDHEAERLVRAGVDDAGRLAVERREPLAVAHGRDEAHVGRQPEALDARLDRPARGPLADDPQRPPAPGAGHRREEVGDALVVRDPAGVEEVVAADGRLRAERRVEAEAQRDRRGAPGVRAGVDDGHDRVDARVRAAVDPLQQRHVDRVRAGEPGGVQRRRGVVDGDDPRAEAVRLARDVVRAPERVVEDHDVGAHGAQRVLEGAGAERDPVAVGRGELERAQLVAAVAVALPPAGHDDVVLERARRPGEPGLLVQVGADPAAARRVEHRHVADDQPVARDPLRPDGAAHAPQDGGGPGPAGLPVRDRPVKRPRLGWGA